jgi:hypothetical protein
LLLDAINNDEDQLKLLFGCKVLRNILTISNHSLKEKIIRKYALGITKRLVILLNYEHMEELMTEVL